MTAKPTKKHQSDNAVLNRDDLIKKVTELERLVDTISRGKMIWEGTFDVITDPVLIIDETYRITRANKATAHAAGTDVREIIGKKCYEVFAGYDSPCPKCPVLQTRSSREPQSVELDPFPKKRQYSANAYSISDVSGRDETVIHYLDITNAKQLQKKLMHSDKMAALGTLAGGIAHEINNPLGGILAFVQLVMRELESDHACQGDLKEIEDAALRCKKIVRNLLDFSRQNFEERMEPVFLNDVIKKTMTLIKINARSYNVEIVQDLQSDLPPVKGDFQKLQQVVLNLITNAIHAMKDKQGGVLTLLTFTNPERRKAFLQVKDTGTGIDKTNLDKIFDPYFTTKGQGEGTGLGLSISYNILKEHGGKIDVESEKGVGTTFTLQFEVETSL
jgi:two-component system NtrC family sensor kinase